jgi:lipopolysaccharide heptosyltransferase I
MDPIPLPAPPGHILLIKPSAVGDVVHALPVLSLLRRRWPGAKVDWLVTPACAGLLDGHPMLNEVIRFERKEYAKSWRSPRALAALFAFARGLRERRYDLVIDLQGLFRSGWLSGATKAPVRVGLGDAREGAGFFYTHSVPTGPKDRHAIERYLCVTEALGCGRGPVESPFATDDADRRHVTTLVPAEPYAALLPGTNWETKRWPVENFAALVGPLRERFGLATVVAGGAGEAELATAIEREVGAGTVINVVGRTTLRQLTALLERAELVVANDSGPMHIAAALGRPLVTPFGPTNPVRTGPFGREGSVIRLDIACSPCYSRKCSHRSCLRWLGVGPVLALAAEQIKGVDRLVEAPPGGRPAESLLS